MSNKDRESIYTSFINNGFIDIDAILKHEYLDWDSFPPEVQGALRKFTRAIATKIFEESSEEIRATECNILDIGSDSFKMELSEHVFGYDYDENGRLHTSLRVNRPPILIGAYVAPNFSWEEKKETRNPVDIETALIQKTDDGEAS